MNKQPVANNYAFIDSQNILLGTLEMGWRLDFRKFRIYLKDKYNVSRAYLFLGHIPENYSLYQKLRRFGYHLIFRPIIKLPNGQTKANCDTDLVLTTMVQYPNYLKAIIVSGDGDFYSLVAHLRQKRKLLQLIVPNKNKYSSLLSEVMPSTHSLTFMNDLEELLKDTKHRP